MNQPPPGLYQEPHSALNGPLLAAGLYAPATAEIACLVLGVMLRQPWFFVIMAGLLVPVMIWTGLLYRNWPTGIRFDVSAVSLGAVGSARAAGRTPTVNHQSRGLFSCPWQAVEGIRVVADRAELRQMRNSPRFYTFTNRWGGKAGMSHFNIGVLASPFMRAALVIDVDPAAVTAPRIRPARYYSNFKNGYLSRLVPPRLSPVWVVPTRRPEALRQALQAVPGQPGPHLAGGLGQPVQELCALGVFHQEPRLVDRDQPRENDAIAGPLARGVPDAGRQPAPPGRAGSARGTGGPGS